MHLTDDEINGRILPGSVCRQFVKRNGKTYGPYYYRFWREGGKQRKRYVPHDQVAEVRQACQRRRTIRAKGNRRLNAIHANLFGRVYGYLRTINSGGKVSKRDRERLERALIHRGILSEHWDR
jgi:hypothetical protein